ncbi:hypothetical protein BT96DRAFT_996463 [Gymnopus androsaceus JB14]|uniref:Uncharacterized protein n=1 Tax=Gymnopus androsaceus JB14 TaxID=1447944 RepID=A0A6A4HFX3_9AGAR|nr:hypothetical protein BT96DRAFT_996463 [Gymnopus androsaceus JB14]
MSSQIAPTHLVQVCFIILSLPTRSEGNQIVHSFIWVQAQGDPSNAKRTLNIALRLSLSFCVGVVVGGLFCGSLFPLLIDLDLMTDGIAGVIHYVSSLRFQDWLAFYVVSLLTFIEFRLRAQCIRVV